MSPRPGLFPSKQPFDAATQAKDPTLEARQYPLMGFFSALA
jgi:hypothetical protein